MSQNLKNTSLVQYFYFYFFLTVLKILNSAIFFFCTSFQYLNQKQNPLKQKIKHKIWNEFFFGMVGQKTSLVNFKHKITTSANYTDGIGTGYTSHDNEMCLHITDLKNYSKSINKIGPVLMPWWNVWGGGVKKRRFFPPKTSYKLGSGVERGEQVGFFAPIGC